MDPKLMELMIRKLNDQIEDRLRFLGSGGCKSYDEYKEVCGAIRGLQTAQMEINDLVRKVKELEDD